MQYVDIRVLATSEADLRDFIKLCGVIQEAGIEGSGKNISIFVDGDGSGRFEFSLIDSDDLKPIPNLEWDSQNTLWLGE